LPELIVVMNAITLGDMAVSMGDLLGSNIANVSLVIGASFVVAQLSGSRGRNITFTEEDKKEFKTGLMFLSITLLILLYLEYVGNIVGVLLLALFCIYSYLLLRKRKESESAHLEELKDRTVRKELALTIVGILGVIIGARLTLESSIEIATLFGIPEAIIGATLVAFGTSLPELSVDIRAAYGGFLEVAMGDIVGSCFMNTTLLLGLLLLFTPFQVNILVLSDLILFSVVSNLILWYFLDRKDMASRGGLVLLTVYIVNLLSLFGILVLTT
jgi:cation:H+ antiporter